MHYEYLPLVQQVDKENHSWFWLVWVMPYVANNWKLRHLIDLIWARATFFPKLKLPLHRKRCLSKEEIKENATRPSFHQRTRVAWRPSESIGTCVVLQMDDILERFIFILFENSQFFLIVMYAKWSLTKKVYIVSLSNSKSAFKPVWLFLVDFPYNFNGVVNRKWALHFSRF